MENTIKADQKRLVLNSTYLNDNSLLEYVTTFGHIEVVVRFVEKKSVIREHTLLRMDTAEYMRHRDHLIEINDDQTAIAVFTPIGDGYGLQTVYDAVKHSFGDPEFSDLQYRSKFQDKELEKKYYKKA